MSPHTTILHLVNRLDAGGVLRHVTDLTAGLEEEGFRILIAAWAPPGSEIHGNDRFSYLPLYDRAGKRKSPLGALRSLRILKRVVQEHGVDVIHSHSRYAAALASRLLRRNRPVRTVFTLHNSFTTMRGFSWYPRDIIVLSAPLREHFLRFTKHGSAHRYDIIHNGVDISEENNAGEAHGEALHFLYVGRLVEEKGLPRLLDAMQKFSVRDNICLTVRGDGELHDRILADASRMAGIIRYDGAVRQPFFDAENVRALCFPSHALEGLPYVVLEAYAAGIPVIAHDLDVLRDVVIEGETGLLVRERSPEAWAAALREAAAQPARLREMGARGRERMRLSYRRDVMVSRTAEVYQRLMCRGQEE